MDALQILLLAAGAAVALAAVALLVLARPYGRLLAVLCGDEGHGRFWRAYTCVAVVLATLFGALITIPSQGDPLWGRDPSLGVALVSFRTGIFCLILALSLVALVLLVSIGQHRADPRATPPSA